MSFAYLKHLVNIPTDWAFFLWFNLALHDWIRVNVGSRPNPSTQAMDMNGGFVYGIALQFFWHVKNQTIYNVSYESGL